MSTETVPLGGVVSRVVMTVPLLSMIWKRANGSGVVPSSATDVMLMVA